MIINDNNYSSAVEEYGGNPYVKNNLKVKY